MAEEETKEVYFYDIYAADVNGADVYFGSDIMGSISNGVLTVCVISKKNRPYYRVKRSKIGYSNKKTYIRNNLAEFGSGRCRDLY